MSEQGNIKYVIRDAQGNIYGPADAAMLREWAVQGRVVAGMQIAPQGTDAWVEASQHAALADFLGASGANQSPPPDTFRPQGTITPIGSSVNNGPASIGGNVVTPMQYASQGLAPSQTLAVWSLWLGIAGPVMTCACGFLCGLFFPLGGLAGIGAIITGIMALHRIKTSPGQYTGRGQAITGIILGTLTLLLGVIGLAVAIVIGIKSAHP